MLLGAFRLLIIIPGARNFRLGLARVLNNHRNSLFLTLRGGVRFDAFAHHKLQKTVAEGLQVLDLQNLYVV